jgi:transcriptional regulator with XRE-family HTH domain
MTARALAASTADYEQSVAAKLRGCLAEKRLTKHDLAQRLGRTDFWIGRRANGQTAISVGELIEIADALGEPLTRFLPEDTPHSVVATLWDVRTRSSTDRASDYGSQIERSRPSIRRPQRRRRSDQPGRHLSVVPPIYARSAA